MQILVYISYNLYLFELEPEYTCKFPESAEWRPCSSRELERAEEWRFDRSRNDLNLDNWFVRLSFHDEANWKIGLIGTIYFFGFIAGSTYFPRLADIYGRRPFVIVGGFIQSICTLLLIFSPNLMVIYFNMFMIGIASPFLSSIGYNYMIELIPESIENPVNTLIMCLDACGSLIGILFFTYFSKSVDTFLWIVGVVGIVASIFHIFTPESPIFDTKEDKAYVDHEAQVAPNSPHSLAERKSTSIWDFITNKTLFVNIAVMVCVWSTTSAGYYLINFNMKYIGGSILGNIFSSVSSEIIASLVASVIFSCMGCKSSLIMFFFISGAAGAVSCYTFESPLIITALVLVAKFGISAAYCLIYITTARIFPPEYAATAFGICNIFARVLTSAIPMIIELPNPFPMMFLAAT